VTTDAEGLATGVAYVDTATGQDQHVRAASWSSRECL